MSKLRVAVLRGGPSSEYEASLASGKAVLANFPDKYEPLDVFIDKEGQWHTSGRVRSEESVLSQCDAVFNCMHGEYGEDGKVQSILQRYGIPYNGARPYEAALAMNKPLAKEHFRSAGIAVPSGYWLNSANEEHEVKFHDIVSTFPLPAITKPASCGSSVGISIARNRAGIYLGVELALRYGTSALVEEFVEGRNATCGVIEKFRGKEYYALPPEEIVLPSGYDIFDYEAKYSGKTQEICPGRFSMPQKRKIEELAIKAHKCLGMRHYSRSDFIVTDNAIYLLETNSLPGLTEVSHIPRELNAVGSSLREFIEHVLDLALVRG
jgi:D-alanine-D-alanine ligase